MRENERTLKMKQSFISLHDQGMSIKDIAKEFGLGLSVVYKNLGEIAISANRDRASLLGQPHKPHLTYDHQYAPLKKVDVDEYRQKFTALKANCRELKQLLTDYIEREEEAMQNGNDQNADI